MRTIKTTLFQLKKIGINKSDLINIEQLGLYGFNTKIINNMIRFEILPDVLFIDDIGYFVKKSEIFGIVETFLENTMSMYATVEENEKKLAESVDFIEANKVKITPEALAKVEAGELTIEEMLSKPIDSNESI